jgi:hypothetical protein
MNVFCIFNTVWFIIFTFEYDTVQICLVFNLNKALAPAQASRAPVSIIILYKHTLFIFKKVILLKQHIIFPPCTTHNLNLIES